MLVLFRLERYWFFCRDDVEREVAPIHYSSGEEGILIAVFFLARDGQVIMERFVKNE